jgi:hypothetical protein
VAARGVGFYKAGRKMRFHLCGRSGEREEKGADVEEWTAISTGRLHGWDRFVNVMVAA